MPTPQQIEGLWRCDGSESRQQTRWQTAKACVQSAELTQTSRAKAVSEPACNEAFARPKKLGHTQTDKSIRTGEAGQLAALEGLHCVQHCGRHEIGNRTRGHLCVIHARVVHGSSEGPNREHELSNTGFVAASRGNLGEPRDRIGETTTQSNLVAQLSTAKSAAGQADDTMTRAISLDWKANLCNRGD